MPKHPSSLIGAIQQQRQQQQHSRIIHQIIIALCIWQSYLLTLVVAGFYISPILREVELGSRVRLECGLELAPRWTSFSNQWAKINGARRWVLNAERVADGFFFPPDRSLIIERVTSKELGLYECLADYRDGIRQIKQYEVGLRGSSSERAAAVRCIGRDEDSYQVRYIAIFGKSDEELHRMVRHMRHGYGNCRVILTERVPAGEDRERFRRTVVEHAIERDKRPGQFGGDDDDEDECYGDRGDEDEEGLNNKIPDPIIEFSIELPDKCRSVITLVCQRRLVDVMVPKTSPEPKTLDLHLRNPRFQRYQRRGEIKECPSPKEGWFKFGDKCYKVHGDHEPAVMDWFEAVEVCERFYGGHLLTVEDEDMLNFVKHEIFSLMKRTRVWLGLIATNETNFKWYDTYADATFFDWEGGTAPRAEEEEHCVRTSDDRHQWEVVNCKDTATVVCQLYLSGS